MCRHDESGKRFSPGVYSPTGIYGDATLANAEKGRIVVEAMVTDVLGEIAALRKSPLPPGAPAAPDKNC